MIIRTVIRHFLKYWILFLFKISEKNLKFESKIKFWRLFIGIFTSFAMSTKLSMKKYLHDHDKGHSRHCLRESHEGFSWKILCFFMNIRRNLKTKNDSWSNAGMQHRFEFENDIIRRMKQIMAECYSKKPEDFCLKLLFDSSFFWE